MSEVLYQPLLGSFCSICTIVCRSGVWIDAGRTNDEEASSSVVRFGSCSVSLVGVGGCDIVDFVCLVVSNGGKRLVLYGWLRSMRSFIQSSCCLGNDRHGNVSGRWMKLARQWLLGVMSDERRAGSRHHCERIQLERVRSAWVATSEDQMEGGGCLLPSSSHYI